MSPQPRCGDMTCYHASGRIERCAPMRYWLTLSSSLIFTDATARDIA